MNVKRNYHFQIFQNCYRGYEHIPISSTTIIFDHVTLSLSNTKLHTLFCLFACLFWFLSHLRIFHSYGEVTITNEGLQNLDLCSALMAIQQWGRVCVPLAPTVTRSICLYRSSPRTRDTHTFVERWQRDCHYLFLRLMSVAARIRTPNILHARRTL